MTFEDYLISKKIDLDAFRKAEPVLFENWKTEFEQMHPNSFTMQKLNLINPIRRKYTLPYQAVEKPKPVEKKAVVMAPVQVPSQTQNEIKTVESAVTEESVKPDDTVQKESAEEVKPVSPASPAKPARPVFKPRPKLS